MPNITIPEVGKPKIYTVRCHSGSLEIEIVPLEWIDHMLYFNIFMVTVAWFFHYF